MNEADLIEQLALEEARDSFWAFRQYMNPKMKKGWFQRDVARNLQQFWDDYLAGKRPMMVIESPPQHGKQIADETPVLTKNGWKTHGDLIVGDYVLHPSGKYIKVLALSGKTPSTMKVSFSNGETIYCHPNHEWTVFNRNKKLFETLETKAMLQKGKRSKDRNPLYTGILGKRGSRYSFQLPKINKIIGEQKELPIDPYVLGAWLGDGSQTKPVITHAESDCEIIKEIERRGFVISAKYKHKITGVISTAFYKNGMEKKLLNAGVFTLKYGERKKKIPETYLTASISQRLDLLAGLIDTDGYTYQKNGRVVFTTSDIMLADTFCQLISTFGWNFSKVTEKPKLSSSGISGKKDYYVIGFNPDIEIPCVLERKKNTPRKNIRRVSITNIEIVDEGKYGRCIQVDSDDGLYLIGKTLIPTHNSDIVTDFIAWASGQRPDLKTIYASFSKRLGVRANKKLQKMFDSPKFKKVFPHFEIDETETVVKHGRRIRNSEFFEYYNAEGSFRNTTVSGAITGESLDLGVIDDPLRGRKDANSLSKRDGAWNWLTDDFLTRFADDAALLAILTRWHVDDPIGRLIKTRPDLKVLKYPAIASDDAPLMPTDQRAKGSNAPLFPEHKSAEFLALQKKSMDAASWQSLYQQNPLVIGGEIIRGACFVRYKIPPKIKYRKIYADTAMKTAAANDYSVFEVWGLGDDGRIYLLDLIRSKWQAPQLRQAAVDIWEKHKAYPAQTYGALREMKVEDKASGTGLIQDLQYNARIPVKGIPRNTDKLTRVQDVLSYIEAGMVCIPESAPWVNDFIAECEAFTADDSHEHDDQIDPMCDAINDLIGAKPKGFFS